MLFSLAKSIFRPSDAEIPPQPKNGLIRIQRNLFGSCLLTKGSCIDFHVVDVPRRRSRAARSNTKSAQTDHKRDSQTTICKVFVYKNRLKNFRMTMQRRRNFCRNFWVHDSFAASKVDAQIGWKMEVSCFTCIPGESFHLAVLILLHIVMFGRGSWNKLQTVGCSWINCKSPAEH